MFRRRRLRPRAEPTTCVACRRMPRVERLYEWLRTLPAARADKILRGGIFSTEPPFFEQIAQMLLSNRTEFGWGGLISVFDRLSENAQQQVWDRPNLIRLGVTWAARSPAATARLNAFGMLAESPYIKLVYLVPDALHDAAPAVRDKAALAFKRMAECFLDHTMPPRDGLEWRSGLDADQREFLSAVWSTVHSFPRHLRVEAFEVSLWFARYFDQELWALLESSRSHAGYVVREHLPSWTDPRLAGFLILALRQQRWRRLAARTLAGWTTLPECRALLPHTELLNDPRVARQIGLVKQPPWFGTWRENWALLSGVERQWALRWATVARLDDDDRVRFLAESLDGDDSTLRRTALYALARCGTSAANRALNRFAVQDSGALGQFANWVVLGRNGHVVPPPPEEEPLPAPNPALAETHHHEFSLFWQMLRRQEMNPKQELFAELRQNLADWRKPLERQLAATDQRDRILALRLIDAAKLLPEFQDAVEPLLDDSMPGVRGLATQILRKKLLGSWEARR